MSARVQNALVFNLCGYDVLFRLAVEWGETFQSKIVWFCRSTRENDLSRISANQVSNLLTCMLTSFFCAPAEWMRARVRITEVCRHVRQHLVKDSWVKWSGRLVVKVNRPFVFRNRDRYTANLAILCWALTYTVSLNEGRHWVVAAMLWLRLIDCWAL